MLKRNQDTYTKLIARLSLSELSSLYERSREYRGLCTAIETEIDLRIGTATVPAPSTIRFKQGVVDPAAKLSLSL